MIMTQLSPVGTGNLALVITGCVMLPLSYRILLDLWDWRSYEYRIGSFGMNETQTLLLMMCISIEAGFVHVGGGLGPDMFWISHRTHGANEMVR